MIKRIFRHCIREPLTCIAAILFAAILSVILCFLHKAQMKEQENYQKTYASIPLVFEITWLDGTRLNDSAPASGHMADILPGLFLGNGRHKSELPQFIDDLRIRMAYRGTITIDEKPDYKQSGYLVGITSTKVAQEYNPSFGQNIQWLDGYDESILRTDTMVCIAPSSLEGNSQVTMTFTHRGTYTCRLKIVGYYPDTGDYKLYCPYLVMETVYARINEYKNVQHLSGTLANKEDLEAFREAAAEWFAEPNATGELTPWGKWCYEYYPLALDIDDSLLRNLEADLKQSMTINRIASLLVFLFSTGAGFLTGFLVIRSRKREIALMRTLGTSNAAVCAEFGLEQLLCVIAGVLLGGSYSLWAPMGQLCIFAGVYLAGLSVALLIFVRINLLATMKEDE